MNKRKAHALVVLLLALSPLAACMRSSSSGGGSGSSAVGASTSGTPAPLPSATTGPLTTGTIPAPPPVTRPPASTTGLTWVAGQPFPTFAAALAFDVTDSGTTADEQYLTGSLQGLVNRTRPRIYFRSAAYGPFWLAQTNVPQTLVADPLTLLVKYASEIKGIVVYDDALLDTVNLATAIAGIEGGVVASPRLAGILTAAPYSFPVLADLRTNHFASATAVYQYELATYGSQLSDRTIVGLDPAIADCLRDYAVATGAAVIWLDPKDATQTALLDQFLARLKTNAPYMGWWTQEQAGVKEASRFGVPTYAANYAQNISALAGVRVAIQPPAPPPPPPLAKKAYVALITSDGDNVEENQNWIIQKWGDPNRGKVPISWTVQPAMVDLDPVTLAYYWSTATPNDVLISGPSGLGYTYPGTWPTAALPAYAQASATALQRAGLKVITAWDNSVFPFAWSTAATTFAANLPHLLGLTDQVSYAGLTIVSQKLPTLGLATAYGATEADLEKGIDGQLSGWNKSAPLFVAVQGDNNQPGMTPTLLLAVQQHYAGNPDVVFVRVDHLFQLIREANGLPTNP